MLAGYFKRHWILMTVAVVMVFIQVVSMLWQPQVISDVIAALSETNEFGVVTPNTELVNQYGWQLIIIGLIGLVAGVLNTFVASYLSQKIGSEIRRDGFEKIQELSFGDIEKFSTSNLVVRLTNDITQVQNFVMMGIQMLLRVPMLFIGSFVMAVITLPSLWWTIILYVAIVFLITFFSMKSMGPRFGKIQGGTDQINGIVKENMDGVRVVKSFVTEEKEEKRYNDKANELTNNLIKVGETFSIMIPMYMLSANIITAFAIYYVADLAIDDLSIIGDLVSFMTYMMQIMFSLVMAGFVSMMMSRAIVSIKRLNEILSSDSSIKFGDQVMDEFESLEFKDVTFRYPGADEDTLHNVSFKINRGEKVGVVGATGSGKTSVVQLIPRLYDIESGEILLNGVNIANYSEHGLRDQISIVLQKAILFSGTIRDNLLHGDADASQDVLDNAAKYAQAAEFIDKKDGKYEAEVQQKGNNFSGGQKQRLSITRGFVRNPEVLILDDSTSALDARSENLVKEAIYNELKDITTIIVAQKISSVVDTDKIIVLKEGRVDAIGKHAELVNISEAYNEIYETQKGKGGVLDEK